MTKYQVEFTSKAYRSYKRLSEKGKAAVDLIVEKLKSDPYTGTEKLSGAREIFRMREGNFRVLYAIDGKQLRVLVTDVGDRKNIYQKKW